MPVNLAPIAKFTMSATEVTLPNNVITVDASESYDPLNPEHDPNKAAGVARWIWAGSTGIVFGDTTTKVKVTTATLPSIAGVYTITLYVKDKKGNPSIPVSQTVTVKPAIVKNRPIDFGVKVVEGNNAEQIAVATKLSVTMLRTSIEMVSFNGRSKFIDDIFAAGFYGCININWLPAGQTRKFCSGADLITYEKNLRWFFDVYCPKGGVHKVKYVFCENEPTHDAYFDDPITNYIPVLEIFTRLSNEYGVKCGCGGVFIEFINAFLNGGVPAGNRQYQNYTDNMWLIERMKTILLTHANAHFALKNTFVDGTISDSMKWLSTDLKRPVGTNEFHSAGATPKQLKQALQEFVDGGSDFIQIWGDGPNATDKISVGTELTELGFAMRDFIKEYNSKV